MRKFLAAAAAVLAFGAAAAVAVLLITRAPRSAAPDLPAAETPAPAPEPAPLPPLPRQTQFTRQQLLPPGAAAEEPPLPPASVGPPRPEPPAGSWEAVAPAPRLAAIGPVGAALGRGLNELQDKLSGCFDEVAQARHGQHAFTTVRDYAPLEDAGATIFMLQVETLQGEVRVVDAPVETRGGASDGLIACAQQLLRGRVIPAPQARPGDRHRVRYALRQ